MGQIETKVCVPNNYENAKDIAGMRVIPNGRQPFFILREVTSSTTDDVKWQDILSLLEIRDREMIVTQVPKWVQLVKQIHEKPCILLFNGKRGNPTFIAYNTKDERSKGIIDRYIKDLEEMVRKIWPPLNVFDLFDEPPLDLPIAKDDPPPEKEHTTNKTTTEESIPYNILMDEYIQKEKEFNQKLQELRDRRQTWKYENFNNRTLFDGDNFI